MARKRKNNPYAELPGVDENIARAIAEQNQSLYLRALRDRGYSDVEDRVLFERGILGKIQHDKIARREGKKKEAGLRRKKRLESLAWDLARFQDSGRNYLENTSEAVQIFLKHGFTRFCHDGEEFKIKYGVEPLILQKYAAEILDIAGFRYNAIQGKYLQS